MTETVAQLNLLLGSGGVLMLLAAGFLIVDYAVLNRQYAGQFLKRFGLLIAAGITVSSLIMALVYSEVFGFVPCGLCWTMRIFVFSQAFILPVAAWRQDFGVAIYGMILSVPGIVVGLYQHYLQMGGSELINCPAAAGDCSKRILFEYGFMTFPLMGASALILLFIIYLYLYRDSRSEL